VFYRFGLYEVDTARSELRKFGVRIRIERKPQQLLFALLDRAGSVVSRAELHRSLWLEQVFVDFDKNLTVAVTKLRAILNDSAENPKYIETVAREGYRFIANVEAIFDPAPSQTALENTSVLPVAIGSGDSQSVGLGPLKHTAPQLHIGARTALIVAIAVIAGGAVLAMTRFSFVHKSTFQHEGTHAKKTMLVVLPFENLSGDPNQDYLADGITEELSEKLGNLTPQRLGVIGRTSAMAYKGSKRTITAIGKDLSVAYVLEGSVRREGKTLRITAQLVEVSDQAHIWAEHYDRDIQDLFEVEGEVASEIAAQVGVSLALEQPQTPWSSHTTDAAAHEDYLVARYYWYKRTPEARSKSEQYFRRAIEKDPRYAAAYAGLAEGTDMPEALADAKIAVELDPRSGEAYSALGWVEFFREWDFSAAAEALKTAIRLDPNYAQAHHVLSGVLQLSGNFKDAIQEESEAVELDPLAFIFRASLAEEFSMAGQNDEAIAQINQIFRIDPQYPKAHETLALIDLRMGKYKKAIREFEVSEKYGLDGELAPRGYAYARLGDTGEALKIRSELQKLEKKSPSGQVSGDLAMVEMGLGDRDAALTWLEKEYQQHNDDGLLSLNVDPIFAPIRTDPRFQALVRRVKIPVS